MSSDNTRDGDVGFIQALAELLRQNDLTEVEVMREFGENDTLNVRVSRQVQVTQTVQVPAAPAATPAAAAPAAPAADLAEIHAYHDDLEARRDELPYEMDGAVAKVDAVESYMNMICWNMEQGDIPVAELSKGKFFATKALEFVASEAMQILGGACYIRGNRIENIYREVKVMAIGGGSEEIMRDLAVRQMGL